MRRRGFPKGHVELEELLNQFKISNASFGIESENFPLTA
jgi:hypothetical protein